MNTMQQDLRQPESGLRKMICADCGREMHHYSEVGYDGPQDVADTSCHPFMAWLLLCHVCATKRGI